MLGGEQVAPIAAIWRTEKYVLNEDRDPEPEDNLPAEDGGVEVWHSAWLLTVECGKAEKQDGSDRPQENSNSYTETGERMAQVLFASSGRSASELIAPGPESYNIELLRPLDGSSAKCPIFDGGTAGGSEVLSEEETTAR